MKSKRGALLEDNALGIIIAIVCIVVLIGGFYVLASRAFSNQESKNARKTLDLVSSTIERLAEGQQTNLTLQGFSNAGAWYLLAWNPSDPDRPQKCFFESCLCVCKGSTSQSCQDLGFCTNFQTTVFTKSKFNYRYIEGGTIDGGLEYAFLSRNCVNLRPNLYELSVSKQQGSFISLDLFSESDARSILSCKPLGDEPAPTIIPEKALP